MKKIAILFFISVALLTIKAHAQMEDPVHWNYGAKKINAGEAILFVKATIEDGWHIYSAYQPAGGPVKTSFQFAASKEYALIGKIAEPTPVTKYEKSFSMNVMFFQKEVIFQQKIKLKKDQVTVKGSLNFMTCNDKKCLPPDDVEFNIPVH